MQVLLTETPDISRFIPRLSGNGTLGVARFLRVLLCYLLCFSLGIVHVLLGFIRVLFAIRLQFVCKHHCPRLRYNEKNQTGGMEETEP